MNTLLLWIWSLFKGYLVIFFIVSLLLATVLLIHTVSNYKNKKDKEYYRLNSFCIAIDILSVAMLALLI